MPTDNRQVIRTMVQFVTSLDIAYNPEPAALFDPLLQGFNLYCIPSDHPGGDWEKIKDKMIAGAFSKRCAFVGTAFYDWQADKIDLSTDAYALRDYLPEYRARGSSIHNRQDDIKWAIDKVKWVFEQIGIKCPDILVGDKV